MVLTVRAFNIRHAIQRCRGHPFTCSTFVNVSSPPVILSSKLNKPGSKTPIINE